jgi:hypothetical protein
MSVIGFLAVVLALLAVLACTRVLQRAAALALHPGGVRMYAPHAVWTAVALLWPVRFLWGVWQLGAVVLLPRHFGFPLFALLVGAGLAQYLMAEAILPRRADDGVAVDLRHHHFRAHRLFFAAAATFRLATWGVNLLVVRPPLLAPSNLAAAATVAVLVLGAASRSPRVHGVLALLAVAYPLGTVLLAAVGR